MPAKKHLHTLKRIKHSKDSKRWGGTYACQDPGCTSYFSHEFLDGKKARCKCGREFIIEPQLHFAKAEMKCKFCMKGKGKVQRVAEQIMADILNPFSIGGVPSEATVMNLPAEEPKQLELDPVEETEELELVADDFDSEFTLDDEKDVA